MIPQQNRPISIEEGDVSKGKGMASESDMEII